MFLSIWNEVVDRVFYNLKVPVGPTENRNLPSSPFSVKKEASLI